MIDPHLIGIKPKPLVYHTKTTSNNRCLPEGKSYESWDSTCHHKTRPGGSFPTLINPEAARCTNLPGICGGFMGILSGFQGAFMVVFIGIYGPWWFHGKLWWFHWNLWWFHVNLWWFHGKLWGFPWECMVVSWDFYGGSNGIQWDLQYLLVKLAT